MQPRREPSLIKKRILEQNLKRVYYFPLIAVPVNLLHVIIFWLALGNPGTDEYLWRLGLIISHLFMMLTAIGMGIIYQANKRGLITSEQQLNLLIYIGIYLFMIVGVGITIIDQMITPSITPFIIFCVAAGVLLLFRPRKMIILFAVAYGLFFFLLPLTQHNPDILASNRVNAVTAIAIGFMISVILWRNAWAGFKQKLIIEAQTKELEISNRELVHRANQLKESNATKEKLLSIIAHDLRSPFNSILGFSSLLCDQVNNLSHENIGKYAFQIHNSATQTLQLLDNLLDWAMLQQDRIALNPQEIFVHKIVQHVFSSTHETANQKSICLTNAVPLEIKVYADENMLKTILRNLIGNAIKFCDNGGAVDVFAMQSGNQVTIGVKDNGRGITPEDAKKLFANTDGLSELGTANETGTGLGLVLCKEFVESHQGTIWVESTPNVGSTFWFTLAIPVAGQQHPEHDF